MTGRISYHKAVRSHAIAALALLVVCASGSFAVAENHANVGTLTCSVRAGTSLTTNLRQRMRCHFVSSWGRLQAYSGIVTQIESNTNLRGGRFMRWSVLTSARRPGRGALVGRYIAASRNDGASPGVGGNDLVGGIDRSIILRPSSSSRGRSGVNLALDVTELTIGYRRVARKKET